jgi:hypothetical protein
MESSTAKGFADIPKLSDAKTYEIWRLAVDDLLRRHKVKRYVEGKKPRPEETSENEDEIDTWESCDGTACSILRSTVSKPIQKSLTHKKTAAEMWTYLTSTYNKEGVSEEVAIVHRWERLTYDGTDINSFGHEYRKCLDDLEAVGIKMDERIAMYVFTSRVSVYHPQFGYDIRRQFRNAKKTDAGLPDLNELIADLIDEVKAQKETKDERALIASRDSRRLKDRKPGGATNGKIKTSGDLNMTYSGCGRTRYEESKCWICYPVLQRTLGRTTSFSLLRSKVTSALART